MTAEDSLQRNKQNVQAFYDLMFNQARPGGDREVRRGDQPEAQLS